MTTAPMQTEASSLLNNGNSSSHKKMSHKQWLACLVCGVIGVALGMILMVPSKHAATKHYVRSSPPPPESPYSKVQGMGYRIYTGGAPQYLADSNETVKNPECKHEYGRNINLPGQLLCYVGHEDPIVDVQHRIDIMKETVERAYDLADKSHDTLKIFIAPESFWRGVHGAYLFADDEGDDDCGPICVLLRAMEELVADAKYKDWLFLFGTIIASEVLPKEDTFDYLFYNFAPVYKGYDPAVSTYEGKRFLVPKRYVSSSDFLSPDRDMNQKDTKELLDRQHLQLDTTVYNPFDFQQKRYDNEMWVHYKQELNELGYTMIEYDWLMMDGISMTIEICFDHYRRTALNSYLADVITGTTALIPSSSDKGLEYVHIPTYQAQISLVSSAGMTVMQDSLALTQNGTMFLQDGVNGDEDSSMEISKHQYNKGEVEFGGGTESIQRKAVLEPANVFFEYKVRDDFVEHQVYPDGDWEEKTKGSFSSQRYEPAINLYNPIDIAKVVA